MIKEISGLNEFIIKCKNKPVYLYGAGRRAQKWRKILEFNKLEISGYLVDTLSGNASTIEDKNIYESAEYETKHIAVLFSIKMKYEDALRTACNRLSDAYYIDEQQFKNEIEDYYRALSEKLFSEYGFRLSEGYFLPGYVRTTCNDIVMGLPVRIVDNECLNILLDDLNKYNTVMMFETLFGKYSFFDAHLSYDTHVDEGTSYSVYMVCCHKDHLSISDNPDWVIPIQAGATVADKRVCELGDDTGDNISDRNADYSECTALYWIWKNAPRTDYIGLCHYRRHFDISTDEIGHIGAQGYDIIATIPTLWVQTRKLFTIFVSDEDIDLVLEAIRALKPEYIEVAEKYYLGHFTPPCNMTIMKYEIFIEYAEFVFAISEYIYQYYKDKHVIRNDRYMGYLIESMTGIFIAYKSNSCKIGYTDMIFYDS